MTIECRVCFASDPEAGPLLRPCNCRGSVAFIHYDCLEKWVESSGQMECPNCQDTYSGGHGLKPVKEWQWPVSEILLLVPFVLLSCLLCYISPLIASEEKDHEDPRVFLGIFAGMLVCCSTLIVGLKFWRLNKTFRFRDRGGDSVEDV